MRSPAGSSRFFLGIRRAHHGVMLITLVQGVIRSFDKHLGPLAKTCRQESGKHTDQDLLDESRLHGI